MRPLYCRHRALPKGNGGATAKRHGPCSRVLATGSNGTTARSRCDPGKPVTSTACPRPWGGASRHPSTPCSRVVGNLAGVLWARGHTSVPCQKATGWSMCRAHTVLAQGIRARALKLPPTILGSDPSGLATLLRCDVIHDSMTTPQKHVLSAVMSSMSMARPNTVF
jgi:hypothetical protein